MPQETLTETKTLHNRLTQKHKHALTDLGRNTNMPQQNQAETQIVTTHLGRNTNCRNRLRQKHKLPQLTGRNTNCHNRLRQKHKSLLLENFSLQSKTKRNTIFGFCYVEATYILNSSNGLSSEANGCSAIEAALHYFETAMVYYHVHDSMPTDPNLSATNPVQIFV